MTHLNVMNDKCELTRVCVGMVLVMINE